MERLVGFAGVRVGEAKHPGPLEGPQLAMLMNLLQALVQLLGQLAGGQTSAIDASLSEASNVLAQLGKPQKELAPSRQVQLEATEEDEWQQPRRRRRKRAVEAQAAAVQTPARPGVMAVAPGVGKGLHQSPGKGQGKASNPDSKGKGKGKGSGPIAVSVPPVTGGGGALRADDWHGKLLSFEDLGDYAAAGESVVVEVRDSSQASIAQAMIRGAELKSSFLIVYPDPEGKQKVPYWKGAVVTMRPAAGCQVPHGTVPLPTLKGKKAAKTITTEASIVVRVIVARDFCSRSEWLAAKKGYRAFVTGKLGLMDAWGAAEEARLGETIVGLARARSASLAALLGRSGQDGLFIEPVGKDPSRPNYGVTWIDKDEAEESDAYFKRVIALKPKHGVVLGRRQLGTRAEVELEKQTRAWRLTGAPKHWGTDSRCWKGRATRRSLCPHACFAEGSALGSFALRPRMSSVSSLSRRARMSLSCMCFRLRALGGRRGANLCARSAPSSLPRSASAPLWVLPEVTWRRALTARSFLRASAGSRR